MEKLQIKKNLVPPPPTLRPTNLSEVDSATTLPWIVKYRPKSLDEVVSHDKLIKVLRNFVKHEQLPHLLFYGQPGTGKTTVITALANELYGENYQLMVLEINASEERGIEVVRDKITRFVSTKTLLMGGDTTMHKLVIMDEADAMTKDAQASLRRIIEKFSKNARFCFICNYLKTISDALQSRCVCFRFSPLQKDFIRIKIDEVVKAENIQITDSAINTVIKRAQGDMRKVLNTLQAVHMRREPIDSDTVNNCLGYPAEKDIAKIMTTLIKDTYTVAYRTIFDLKQQEGYYINDIINELYEYLMTCVHGIHGNSKGKTHTQLTTKIIMTLIAFLAEIQHNTTVCTIDDVQLNALVGGFKYILNTGTYVKDLSKN
jgi:replication factor C subunit 3/5